MSTIPIRLGPFTGGINKAADPSVIEDTELLESLNFELDIDGSLVYRPPIVILHEGASDERLLVFGSVTFSSITYLFGSRDGSTYVSSDEGENWTVIGTDREAVTMAVYQETVWFPATPTSVDGSFSWTVSGGFTAQADIPRGVACTVHKNRLYICPGPDATSNASRLHFSEAADFTDFPSTNFVDVVQGDGTTLNNIIVYQDNLLLFKTNSTHVLAYDLDPSDAILREVNSVVGTFSNFGVVQHENTVYCLHLSHVYAIINFNFELLNLKMPFEFENSMPANTTARYEPLSLSLLGDRLVVRFFNKTYVYGLRTKTWSEWQKTDDDETVEWHVFGPLIRIYTEEGAGVSSYYSSYSFDMDDSTGYKIIRIKDDHTATDMEGYGDNNFHCIATTKHYDLADPIRFKRLGWWGADLLTGNDIVASVEPITLSFTPSWEDLGDLTFGELGTWGSPTEESLSTVTEVEGNNNFSISKFVKFHKSLRFRKINFSIMLVTSGATVEETKLFSIVGMIKTKATVVSQES